MRATLVMALMLLAGCAAPSPSFPTADLAGSAPSGRLDMTVLKARTASGDCAFGETAMAAQCHWLTVRVHNNATATIQVSQFNFLARDGEGTTVAKASAMAGSGTLPRNATRTYEIGFEFRQAHATIVGIDYANYFDVTGSADVPPY